MRTIIAGSREINDYDALCKCISRCPFKDKITLVISGTAKGVDQMGERWAEENNIPIQRFPADWDKYGKGAGPIRNRQMANNADALIVLMIPESRGSKNMYETAKLVGIKNIHREFYEKSIMENYWKDAYSCKICKIEQPSIHPEFDWICPKCIEDEKEKQIRQEIFDLCDKFDRDGIFSVIEYMVREKYKIMEHIEQMRPTLHR